MKERLSDVFGEENRTLIDFIKMGTYGVFMYLNINTDIIFILSVLMVLDMGSGIIKSLKLGKRFSFKIMMWGFVTKIMLLTIPLVVALMGKALGKDFVWTVDLAVKMLVVNEGFSILANILSVKQHKDIENFDFISWFIEWLKEFFLEKFKQFINHNTKGKDE